MGDREEMLAALRRSGAPPAPLPDLAGLGLGVHFDDPAEAFARSLAGVAGTCVRVADVAGAQRALEELPVYRGAAVMVSLVAGVGRSDIDLGALSDPHELEGIDLAVVPGEFAVAENGAVWVDGAALPHRAVFVITEHLVLVVGANAVVHDMHEAYARVAARRIGYGVFISGPSKTADIEQALVIGAQGPRSCTVLLVG